MRAFLRTSLSASATMRAVRRGRGRVNVADDRSRFRRWAQRLVSGTVIHRKTEITIETERVLIIRRSQSRRAWCGECGREVDIVGLAEAAMLTGAGQSLLRDSAEGRGWHVSEDRNGAISVCLDSVVKPR